MYGRGIQKLRMDLRKLPHVIPDIISFRAIVLKARQIWSAVPNYMVPISSFEFKTDELVDELINIFPFYFETATALIEIDMNS